MIKWKIPAFLCRTSERSFRWSSPTRDSPQTSKSRGTSLDCCSSLHALYHASGQSHHQPGGGDEDNQGALHVAGDGPKELVLRLHDERIYNFWTTVVHLSWNTRRDLWTQVSKTMLMIRCCQITCFKGLTRLTLGICSSPIYVCKFLSFSLILGG